MKDRVPQYPGRVTLTPVSGQANTYDMVRADAPVEAGTPLNKANLMPDTLATTLGLNPATATVAEGIAKVNTDVALLEAAATKKVIFSQAPTSNEFVVDVSTIDFSKVKKLVVEFLNITTSTSGGTGSLLFRDAQNNLIFAPPTVDLKYSSTYGSSGIILLDFSEVVAATAAGNTYSTNSYPKSILLSILILTKNIRVTASDLNTSIQNRKVVIWYV